MDQIEEKKWFVFLGDHHEGPFTAAEIQNKFDEKQINMSSFIWAEGMTDWKLMKEVSAFDVLERRPNGTPAAPVLLAEDKSANLIKLDIPKLDPVVSLPLDMAPVKEKQEHPDKIEKAWKRRQLIRRTAMTLALMAIAGGAGYTYQQGQIQTWVEKSGVKEAWTMAADWAHPQMLKLSEKYPILRRYISPIPRLEDVSSDDYVGLKTAAMAPLEQGPSVALVVSKEDPFHPSFYVSSNLPDGAAFDLYIEGVPGTLVGHLRASTKVSVVISKKLGKSAPLQLTGGKPIPRGEYQVFATENNNQTAPIQAILSSLPPLNAAGTDRLPAGLKLLARRTYFLGGPKDAVYTQKLKEYHDQLREKARLEMGELRQFVTTLENQFGDTVARFKELHRTRGMTAAKRKSWTKFHDAWMKQEATLNEPFQKVSSENFQNEYLYSDLYELVKQSDESVQRLHKLQDEYFVKKADERALEIQLGEAESVAQSTMVTLKTKIDQAEKTPSGP